MKQLSTIRFGESPGLRSPGEIGCARARARRPTGRQSTPVCVNDRDISEERIDRRECIDHLCAKRSRRAISQRRELEMDFLSRAIHRLRLA